jgi:hypothetical protein
MRRIPSGTRDANRQELVLRLHVKHATADQAHSDQWLRDASVPEHPALTTDEGVRYCNVAPTYEELVGDVYR